MNCVRLLAAVVALTGGAPAALASVPLTSSTTSGYTFSGFERSVQNGETSDTPTPPRFVPGHQTSHSLSWDTQGQERFAFCDLNQPVSIFSSVVVNQVVLHYTVDATGTPGDVTAVDVVIPAFTTQPPGATTEFPIAQLGVSVQVSTAGGPVVSGVLSPIEPPGGAGLAYEVTFPTLIGVDGLLDVHVTLSGQVEPALVVTSSGLSSCPPGVTPTPFTNFAGSSTLTVEGTFVGVYIESAVAGAGVVYPSVVTLNPFQTQDFAAWDCPPDENGNPDLGQDGVPGTEDDLCESNGNAVWRATGAVGALSNSTGPTTTLTAGDGSAHGQVNVVAPDGTTTAFADVFIGSPPFPADMDGDHDIDQVDLSLLEARRNQPAQGVSDPGDLDGDGWITGLDLRALAIRCTRPGCAIELAIFDGWNCPLDGNGNPDPGPDGVPGTRDDFCTPACGLGFELALLLPLLRLLARRRRIRTTLLALVPLALLVPTDPARAVTLTVVPDTASVPVGGGVSVAIGIEGLGDGAAPSLGVFDLALAFDPALLAFTGASYGDPLLGDQLDLGAGSFTDTTPTAGSIGLFEVSFELPATLVAAQLADFTLVTADFVAVAAGASPLDLTVLALGDQDAAPLVLDTIAPGSVTVVPEPTTAWLLAVGFLGLALTHRRPRDGVAGPVA